MLPERLYLIDWDKALVDAWREAFAGIERVEPIQGDFFDVSADAMVSPANSFGIMDGGLDLAIRDTLGLDIEARVQARILNEYHGELPVGNALIVETRNERWPYLVSAPTMRVPQDVSNTLNAYLAFRAILLALKRFNESQGEAAIRSIVCPGLGTGVGNLAPKKCAAQMRVAYDDMVGSAKIPSPREIHEVHRRMMMAP